MRSQTAKAPTTKNKNIIIMNLMPRDTLRSKLCSVMIKFEPQQTILTKHSLIHGYHNN